jgi:hypothetical protein
MKTPRSVMQEWTQRLSMMQQTVLLTAVRGPDGLPKYGPTKMLLRWYRRCILLSALDGKVLTDPAEQNGGSFTGPSISADPKIAERWELAMNDHVVAYMRELDQVPHHFQMHLLHAIEIVGYKHPDTRIRQWWGFIYRRLVNDLHLHPESEAELDRRLGDTREGWLERADEATNA